VQNLSHSKKSLISHVVPVAVVFMSSILCPISFARSNGTEELLENAAKLRQSGDYNGAITVAEQAIRAKSDSWQAHLELAKDLNGAGKLEAATAAIFESLRFNNQNPEARKELGAIFMKQGWSHGQSDRTVFYHSQAIT
jgi:thioredoxin-like negative regulator of GroEL